jgi:hypothetical protein
MRAKHAAELVRVNRALLAGIGFSQQFGGSGHGLVDGELPVLVGIGIAHDLRSQKMARAEAAARPARPSASAAARAWWFTARSAG